MAGEERVGISCPCCCNRLPDAPDVDWSRCCLLAVGQVAVRLDRGSRVVEWRACRLVSSRVCGGAEDGFVYARNDVCGGVAAV